jgi:hypothetical protein
MAEDFKLSEITDERDVLALHAELDPGTRVFAYRIEPGELERVKAFRRTALRRSKGRGLGSRSASSRTPVASERSHAGRF